MTLATAPRTEKPPANHPVPQVVCCYCGTNLGTAQALGKHLIEDHVGETDPSPAAAVSPDSQVLDDLLDPEVLKGLLSADEERVLAEALRRNGPEATEARRVFVERNQGLVVSIAKRYQERGLPLPDLVQEGNLGLLKAVEKFDPERGTRFSTCAMWWVMQAVRRALSDTSRLVRIPVHLLDLAYRARKLMSSDASMDVDAAAEALGTDPARIEEALGIVDARSISMESGDRDGDGRSTLGATLASPDQTPSGTLGPDERERLLEGLTPRHRMVLNRRFGLDGKPAVELEVVGRELGISRERVRQIEAQALAYLRRTRVKEGPNGDLSLNLSAAAPIRVRQPKIRLHEPDPNAPGPKERPAEKRTPLPHQEEALAVIVPELESRSRATAVMACGTGKTLVGAWAFERSKGKTALVLGPSLSLLRQSLREWLAHDVADRYLCVCSDATVSENQGELRVSAYELGIPVTTNPAEVRRILSDGHPGRTVVICTYQSARALGSGLPPGFRFDLAIFDEAHRTAGQRDRNFSFGLLDSQIGARRRLFMTATPRGISVDGSDEGPFSMDDEKIYGRRVYELGLSEAIERGIVCEYKIVVAVVTKTDVASALRGDPGVRGKGFAAARRAAISVAFARAVQECGAAKIITFHESVAAAHRFASSRWLREDLLPEGFQSYHVNGRMSAGDRQAILSKFEAAGASIITNARCLNEGIDLPAVDMVGFMSPKRSLIDIVQAIGRVLRKAPGKTVGYVVLPIIVDGNGNPISSASECRDFSRVLHSLRSQDKDLDRRIRKNAFDRGAGLSSGSGSLDGLLLIAGPETLPDSVRGAITTKILSPLGPSWDEMFGRLVAFRRSRSDVEKTEAGRQILKWMTEQRMARRRKALSQRQITLLESINFSWEPKRESWSVMIEKLREWKELHGHFKVTSRDRKLGGFVSNCRRMKRQGDLLPERIAELEAMGFEWLEEKYEHIDDKWMRRYRLLKRFQREGDPDLNGADHGLRRWASHQRDRKKKGLLDLGRVQLLDDIGFKWVKSESRLLRPREFSREKADVGTIRVRRDFTNGRDLETRWIKVSDQGPEQKRWMAYARWWWEKNRGPVPKGMGIIHRNGNSMDDSPENLMVGTAADRIRLAHLNDPEMSKRNMRTVHEGCAKWNREQGKKFRFENIVRSSWYPMIVEHQVIINVSFRKRTGLFRAFDVDVSRIPLCGHGPEVDRAIEISGILPLSSKQVEAEPYSRYPRVDVELGLANPEAAGPGAEDRIKAVMAMPLWRHAKAAAALDVHERC